MTDNVSALRRLATFGMASLEYREGAIAHIRTCAAFAGHSFTFLKQIRRKLSGTSTLETICARIPKQPSHMRMKSAGHKTSFLTIRTHTLMKRMRGFERPKLKHLFGLLNEKPAGFQTDGTVPFDRLIWVDFVEKLCLSAGLVAEFTSPGCRRFGA